MNANVRIGRAVRWNRERREQTQEQLATTSDITPQYLSGIENGHQNITLEVLERLANGFGSSIPQIVADAYYGAASESPSPQLDRRNFRRQVPLPPKLTVDEISKSCNDVQNTIHVLNSSLHAYGSPPLSRMIQGNNFSGIVSNLLTHSIGKLTAYKANEHTKYPDLILPVSSSRKPVVGLEVKSTIQIGKGGESHNGHSGWHMIACFKCLDNGDIKFIHVMFAELIGHSEPGADWKYLGSRVNEQTGSQRTETYNTTAQGTTKLRDGSVYLDPVEVKYHRWRQARVGKPPAYSIFAADPE